MSMCHLAWNETRTTRCSDLLPARSCFGHAKFSRLPAACRPRMRITGELTFLAAETWTFLGGKTENKKTTKQIQTEISLKHPQAEVASNYLQDNEGSG